ncbi:MAG: hypothetical protein ACFE78_04285 [Candidatus Hodarchaeota archaeon]
MSPSDTNKVINLTVTKFPQNLLVPNGDNHISLQIMNTSDKVETLKFSFEGESLDITYEQKEFEKEIKFEPGESRKIDLKLIPTADGYGKLTINAYWMKLIEYTVKVQKVRDVIASSNIKKILGGIQILTTDSGDKFKPEIFFINKKRNDLKKLESEIKSMRADYESYIQSQAQSNEAISTLVPPKPGISLENIDAKIKILAKHYLSIKEFYRALETSLQLSNETERVQFYYDLIRAFATVDLDACLQVITNLNDKVKKLDIINKLALDFVDLNHDHIIKIISLIKNPLKKEELIAKVVGNVLKKDYQLALKLAYLIQDEMLKVKVLFNVAKKLYESKNQEEILKIINQINQIIINSSEINLNNPQHPSYQFLKNAICILAELDCPEAADKIINSMGTQVVRESITNDLFDEIYVMVDELRTKIEPTLIFSQYYLLNVFTSKITNEITDFSINGGNVSNNLLSQEYNFNIAFLSLFSYDFGIFPIVDRIYSDLKFNSNKSIAYYIYPSIRHHNQEESTIIQNTLRFFLPPNKISNQVYLFNLDFIPYLGKPTIILASDSEDLNLLKSKIIKKLGNNVQVLVDNSFFKGGQIVTNLKNIYMSYNFKIINLILSYEFLNDHTTFKAFVESLL